MNRSKRLSSQNKVQIQVEQPRDLARDSGQRKLTYSLQNHCASSRSVYLSRRLDSHLDELAVTHHLKEVGVFSTEINFHFTKGLYRRFFPDCSPFIISFTVLFLLLVYFFSSCTSTLRFARVLISSLISETNTLRSLAPSSPRKRLLTETLPSSSSFAPTTSMYGIF